MLDRLAETSQVLDRIRQEIEREVRYANITIIEGIGASQQGIGMVCARIPEMILPDERTVIPIGAYSSKFGVTLPLPSVMGREGVVQTFEPEMSDAEQQGLQRSAEAIKESLTRINFSGRAPKAA